MHKCTDRLVADTEAATDAEKEQIRRYVEETYCSRFAERGWVYDDGTLSIEAHKWLQEGEADCARAIEEAEATDEDTGLLLCESDEDRLIDCALLHHVRQSEVHDYVEKLRRRQGDVECDDGTPLDELGVPSTSNATAEKPPEGDESTAKDREVIRSFVAFARSPTEARWKEVPFAPTVDLGLASQLLVRRSASELRDPAAWLIGARLFRGGEGFDGHIFRGYVGPFSALRSIAMNRDRPLAESVGPHRHCVSPPVPPPRRVESLRRVSVQPKTVESCLQWWTVDLYVTDDGEIRAVTFDHWEP